MQTKQKLQTNTEHFDNWKLSGTQLDKKMLQAAYLQGFCAIK